MGLFFHKKKKEEPVEVVKEEVAPVELKEDEKVAAARPATVENEVPAEIVAVIAAALACTLGAGVKILSVKRAESGRGRSSWSLAGLLENTRPF